MMKLFTRQNVTIAVAILLVVFVIYARTSLEMSEGDKTTVRQYLIENGDAIKAVSYTHLTLPTIYSV